MSETKGPGQPTKYKPEYCEQLIEHMKQGLSYEAFVAVVGVHRSNMYKWEELFPEFAEAKEKAFGECLLFWEKLGINNIVNTSESFGKGEGGSSKSLNASVWIFNMKNRFKWRDKQPDEVDTVINNVSSMSDEELKQKLAEKIKKLSGNNES